MATATPTGGEIHADAAYCLPDFMQRTFMGWKSIRRARRQGLRVTKIGNRCYVRGSDWLAYLEKQAKVEG